MDTQTYYNIIGILAQINAAIFVYLIAHYFIAISHYRDILHGYSNEYNTIVENPDNKYMVMFKERLRDHLIQEDNLYTELTSLSDEIFNSFFDDIPEPYQRQYIKKLGNIRNKQEEAKNIISSIKKTQTIVIISISAIITFYFINYLLHLDKLNINIIWLYLIVILSIISFSLLIFVAFKYKAR